MRRVMRPWEVMMGNAPRTRGARPFRALLACVLLAGCTAAVDSPTDPDDPPGEPDPQTALTDVQRMAALKAVADRIPALAGADADSRRAELLAWLGSRSEFEASGANEDGSLWARFTDGRLFLIIANRDETVPSEGESAPAPANPSQVDVDLGGGAEATLLQALASAPGPPAELPASTQARVLGGGELPTDKFFTTFMPKLQSLLTQGGYQLATNAVSGTIDELLKVGGDGVFYFGGHGGEGQNRNLEKVYGVTTATLVSLQNDAIYRGLWADSSLVYTLEITSGLRPFPTCQTPCVGYYGFTAEFVRKHMQRFSDGSMVYIAACTSAEPGFRQAFHDQGAGVYFGWNGPFAADVDSRATSFLFDRLLGVNSPTGGPLESPPQRPFDYVSVFRDMQTETLTTSGGATLGYYPGPTESGLLAPSIQYIDVDESSSALKLTGKFGSAQGEVSINGVSANLITIVNWTKDSIRVEIPVSGPYSAGDVVVWSKGRRSNTRRLSEWRPKFNLEFKADGTLKWEGEVRLHIRADLSSYREEAGDSPEYRTVPFQIARDSDGELEASGTYNTTKWSGTARITNRLQEPFAPNVVDGIGEVTTASPFMRLALFVTATEGMIATNSSGDSATLPAVWAHGDGFLSPQKPLPALYIGLDQEFGILGDFRRLPVMPSPLLFWSDLKPSYIPADSLAR